MYKIKAFSNAEEFNELFGLREHGNGVKSRRNAILLAFYKSKTIWEYCRKYDLYSTFFSITSMAGLKSMLKDFILDEMYRKNRRNGFPVLLMGDMFFSKHFETDECNGIPSNGDVGFVRYKSREKNRNGKVYRMKAGRFYKRLLLETELGAALPEQVLNWLCENFTERWSSYVMQTLPKFSLVVDDDFEKIYNYGEGMCSRDFGSCMMGDGQWRFYRDCVNAKSASLVNEDGFIVARCVIFNEVRDEEGKVWRLAERQYSEDSRDLYKRCLVDALIAGNYIDGYKQVGVDCHATTSYVDNDGNSLSHKRFQIDCNLEWSLGYDDAWNNKDAGRILSYQDSFKWYDYVKHIAYNYLPASHTLRTLDMTDSYIRGYHDDYHNRMCAGTISVMYDGRSIDCDKNDLSDFADFDGIYYHVDELSDVCPVCGRKMPTRKLYRSLLRSFNGEMVCSRDCMVHLRDEYRRKHCFYNEFNGEWVEKKFDKPVKVLYLWSGCVSIVTCSESYLKGKIGQQIVMVNGIPCAPLAGCRDGAQGFLRKFSDYMKSCSTAMQKAISEIVEKNKAENVAQNLTSLKVEV